MKKLVIPFQERSDTPDDIFSRVFMMRKEETLGIGGVFIGFRGSTWELRGLQVWYPCSPRENLD